MWYNGLLSSAPQLDRSWSLFALPKMTTASICYQNPEEAVEKAALASYRWLI